jgi:hypothetical protein
MFDIHDLEKKLTGKSTQCNRDNHEKCNGCGCGCHG